MKKIFYLFLVLTLALFAFVGCKGEKKDPEPDTPDEPTIDEGKIDIFGLDYVLVYNSFAKEEAKAAEDFIEALDDKIGKELEVIDFSEDSEYEIQFGILTNRDKNTELYSAISAYKTADMDAYAVKIYDKTIVVTATSAQGLRIASDKLLTYASGKKLLIPSDLELGYIYNSEKYDNGDVEEYAFDTLDSNANISSVSVKGKKITGFDPNTEAHVAAYSAAESIPDVSCTAYSKNAKVTILQPSENNGVAKITVKSKDGTQEKVYTIDFEYGKNMETKAEIVNKDGKDGAVFFVFDDGFQDTADLIATNILPKYDSIRLSYALNTSKIASLTLSPDGYEWVKDSNGKYKITPKANTYNSKLEGSIYNSTDFEYVYDFWKSIAERDGVELLSHSHTHSEWGMEDYATVEDGKVKYPNGNVTKELLASQQIIRDLCDEEALVYIKPGVGDCTGNDATYYHDLISKCGVYIGARGTGANAWRVAAAVNKFSDFGTVAQNFLIHSYAVKHHSTQKNPDGSETFTTVEDSTNEECIAAGISVWEEFINAAITDGGMTGFCIHSVVPDDSDTTSKWHIYESQLDALFAYAQNLSDEGKLWIPTITEATKYYTEWSSAKVEAKINGEESVSVKLTHKEDMDIYNEALTVKVNVPRSWTSAVACEELLELHTDEDGNKFVYVDVMPNSSAITITQE